MLHLLQFKRMGSTHLCKYTAFCVASSHTNTFRITYILLRCTQVSKHCKASFNRLQNQFVFHEGNGRTLLDTVLGFPYVFPSGCVNSCPDIGVFKCRKWYSSWVLCHEDSGYDLSEHQQDFLSLPPCLFVWANSRPARSPPITWASKPPPLCPTPPAASF